MAIPFILTRRMFATPPVAPPHPVHRYDPERQFNVTPDGRALIDQIEMFGDTYTVNSGGTKKDPT
jgi:putative ATP-grasp target RiPP